MLRHIVATVLRVARPGWRILPRAVALVLTGLMASCIDGREEYWLGRDGSGRAELEYSAPSSLVLMEGGEERIRKILEEFFRDSKTIRDGICEVTTRHGRTRVKVNFAFDSGMSLAEASGSGTIKRLPAAVGHLVGEVDAHVRGLTLEFSRTARPDKAIPLAGLLPHRDEPDAKLLWIVHLPIPVRESNATRVTDAGRTLFWERSIAGAVTQPMTMRFTMDLPLPWGWITVGSALLLGVLATALMRLIIKRRKSPNRGSTPRRG